MSLAALLTRAATTAQRTLASMDGAAASTSTNFTLNGTAYQGVIVEGTALTEPTATGYEVIKELRITATRDQFAAKPSAAPRLPVTALGGDWYLTAVGESSLHYFLTCRPA